MPFTLQYKPFIESEESIGKTLLKPRNIYRINSYKYADGTSKSFSTSDSALVFLIGITPDKRLLCLKISEIKPEIFFRWFKKIFIKSLNEEEVNKAESLDELLIFDNRDGRKLFSQFVKPSSLYTQEPCPYRTYTIKGIKNIEMVNLKKSAILKYYK
jgi:hypothetical protein